MSQAEDALSLHTKVSLRVDIPAKGDARDTDLFAQFRDGRIIPRMGAYPSHGGIPIAKNTDQTLLA